MTIYRLQRLFADSSKDYGSDNKKLIDHIKKGGLEVSKKVKEDLIKEWKSGPKGKAKILVPVGLTLGAGSLMYTGRRKKERKNG